MFPEQLFADLAIHLHRWEVGRYALGFGLHWIQTKHLRV